VLAAFSKKYSESAVIVVEEITPLLLERLRTGSVDIAILALPVRGHEFDSLPLLTEPLFAALPKKHRLARRAAISLRDLRKEPFLLLRDGHCFRENAVAACDRARVSPQVVFESGQFSSLLGLVGSGMGVSLVPSMAVDRRSQVRFVRISDPGATRTIGAISLRGRSLSRAHQAFLSTLRQSG
jgi:LysR family hydrogen peroxide-inducible transcriptional activator